MVMAGARTCRVCNTRYPADARFCLNDASELIADSSVVQAGFVGIVLGGKYRVVRRIGVGGMGDVYEAEHTKLGKRLAVKVLHRQFLENREALERFEREARLAASIGHPGITDVIDFDRTEDGSTFMVMEFLDGEELRTVLKREKRLPYVRACYIVSQIADAVGAAHRQGIIHRDLKPENVVLITRGSAVDIVKVFDFGVSKMQRETGQLTRTGMIVGTPYYMSPEQIRGDTDIDARSDIYAIGAMFYELLTGVVPFYSDDLQSVLLKVLAEPLVVPSARAAGIPLHVEQVVVRALAREREQRYVSCEALANAAKGALATAESAALDGVPTVVHSFLGQHTPIPVPIVMPTVEVRERPIDDRHAPVRSASGLYKRTTPSSPVASRPVSPEPFSRTPNLSTTSTPSMHGVARTDISALPEGPSLKARVLGWGAALLVLVIASVLIRATFQKSTDSAVVEQVTITFESIPVLAEVKRDGSRLCETPCMHQFARNSTRFEVLFEHPGYLPEKRSVLLDQDRTVFATLERMASP